MTFSELAQIGLGTAGTGGGLWALVRAFIAIKPHLKNGNGYTQILRHLEKQGDSLASIAQDIHLSAERWHEFARETHEYQKEGRAAMLHVAVLYDKATSRE